MNYTHSAMDTRVRRHQLVDRYDIINKLLDNIFTCYFFSFHLFYITINQIDIGLVMS
jgi:hypothetical protein